MQLLNGTRTKSSRQVCRLWKEDCGGRVGGWQLTLRIRRDFQGKSSLSHTSGRGECAVLMAEMEGEAGNETSGIFPEDFRGCHTLMTVGRNDRNGDRKETPAGKARSSKERKMSTRETPSLVYGRLHGIRKRGHNQTHRLGPEHSKYELRTEPTSRRGQLKRRRRCRAELSKKVPTESIPAQSTTDQETSRRCASRSGFMSQTPSGQPKS